MGKDDVNGSNLAPIALFAYNRADVLSITLDALKNNTLASQSVLYVFSDGPKPKTQGDDRRVQEVRDLISTIEGFREVKVTRQKSNIGLARSVIAGITEVIDRHGKIIVLEDDLITSEHFLTYMNDALTHYENYREVYCINGMSVGPEVAETASADTYFLYRNSSHGWGTWADRWSQAEWDTNVIDFELGNFYNQLRFDRGGDDLTEMLRLQVSGHIDSWAIRWSYSIARQDGRCLSPVHSYVTHQVSDRGTHIRQFIPSLDHNLELSKQKPTYPATTEVDPEIARRFARIYCKTTPFLLLPEEERLKDRDLTAYVDAEHRLANERSTRAKPRLSVAMLAYGPLGGAGIATEAIHNGLIDAGANSHLIMCDRQKPIVRGYYWMNPAKKAASDQMNLFFKDSYQLEDSTFVTINTSSVDREQLRILSRFDIINIHWVAWFLSLEDIAAILKLGKPVVWTMHDRAALTGGCHYFHGCENWLSECEACPQIRPAKNDYPSLAFSFKAANLDRSNLTLLSLSQTNAKLAKRTPLYRQAQRVTIPVAVDTEVFRPLDRDEARRELGIEEDVFTILYSATSSSSVKGAGAAQRILSRLAKFDRKTLMLAIGEAADTLDVEDSYCRKIGFIRDKAQLRKMYSAADVTLVPSQDEGMPNVAVESVACGTPIVGYDVGIMPELAAVASVGQVVPVGDEEALYQALRVAPLKNDDVSAVCRDVATTQFSPGVIAQRYIELFQRLHEARATPTLPVSRRPERSNLEAAVYDFASETIAAQTTSLYSLRAKLSNSQKQADTLQTQVNRLRDEIRKLRNSLSWRVTRPLRTLRQVIRKTNE